MVNARPPLKTYKAIFARRATHFEPDASEPHIRDITQSGFFHRIAQSRKQKKNEY